MAMTKKERAEFDALLLRAETLAALRWTNPVARDVPSPTNGGYSEGFDFNAYGKSVWQAWSGSTVHGRGPAPKPNERYQSASQNCRHLYSTKTLALAAMRYEMEKMAATDLLEVDRLMRASGES